MGGGISKVEGGGKYQDSWEMKGEDGKVRYRHNDWGKRLKRMEM